MGRILGRVSPIIQCFRAPSFFSFPSMMWKTLQDLWSQSDLSGWHKFGQTDDTNNKSKKFQRALTKSVWVRSEMVQMGNGFSPKKSKERHAIINNPGNLYNIKGKVLGSKKYL
jgi:hypothetical protein